MRLRYVCVLALVGALVLGVAPLSGAARKAGTAHRVVTGLASVADEEGFGATGLDGISALGNGTFYGIMAEACDKVPDVGELTGGANPSGSAAVWRFAPGEATPLTQWATGLTTITGCGFGADGNRRVAVRLQLEYRSCGHRARLRDPDHAVRRSPAATARTFPRRRRPAVD
jgi:hypothetical protein